MDKVHQRLTVREFEDLKRQISKIIQRNNIKSFKELQEKLSFYTSINSNQLKNALRVLGVEKDTYYYLGNNENLPNKLMKTCMRCEESKKFTNFKSRREYFSSAHRLNICNECIREEHNVLGTSVNDLLSIYEFMEFRYKSDLRPEYYNRFWEKVI